LKEPIDYNTNYRQFYCKDHSFFLWVIEQEQAPFDFKIYLFPSD
jgi:hypothetical protein